MSYLALQYSTGISQGCGLFDAVDARLNRWIPSQTPIGTVTKGLGGRIISAGITYGLPMYLSTSDILNKYPTFNYFNPILRNRMFLSSFYNGFNTAGHLAASCYNVIKGDNHRAANHAKIALKFFWRGAIDTSLLCFAPEVAIKALTVGEAALNVIAPNKLKDGLNFIANTLDKAIGETDDIVMPSAYEPVRREIGGDEDYYNVSAGGGDEDELFGDGEIPNILDDDESNSIAVNQRRESDIPEPPADPDAIADRDVIADPAAPAVADLGWHIPTEQVNRIKLFERIHDDPSRPTQNRYSKEPISALRAIELLVNWQQVYWRTGKPKHYHYYPVNPFIYDKAEKK